MSHRKTIAGSGCIDILIYRHTSAQNAILTLPSRQCRYPRLYETLNAVHSVAPVATPLTWTTRPASTHTQLAKPPVPPPTFVDNTECALTQDLLNLDLQAAAAAAGLRLYENPAPYTPPKT